MHFRAFVTAVLVFIGIILAGCNRPIPTFDLEPTANKLFKALQEQDVATALTYYSEDFFKAFPREQWRHYLEQFATKMGPMESFRLRKKQADTRFSGKFYIYQYETVHRDNKKARHIVTYIHPIDGDTIKLIAHKITAKHFP